MAASAGLVRQARRTIADGGSHRREATPADRLIAAARSGDGVRLREVTSDDFEFELRSDEGDLRAHGGAAHGALLALGERVLRRIFASVDWHATYGTPWTSFLFQAVTGDATRVDVSLHAYVRDGRVTKLAVIAAGDLEGRPPGAWKLAES